MGENGKIKLTSRHRILQRLIEARETGEKFWRHHQFTPPGWVPADVLMHPDIGGISALRRLRELRERGIRIEWRYFVTKKGKRTNTTLYYLVTNPEDINFKECRYEPKVEQEELPF